MRLSFIVFVTTLINLISIWFILEFFKSKSPLTENDNDLCEFKKSQKSEYNGLWIQVGYILGPYFSFFVMKMSNTYHENAFSGTNNDIQVLEFIIIILSLTIILEF